MRITIILIAFCANLIYADPANWHDSFISGALSGIATTVVLEPMLYVKNRWQQGLSIRWHPSSLWRGLPVNAAGFVPTMAIQNMAYSMVREQIAIDPTKSQTLLACLAAGCASALPACPRELIILHQQNLGGSSLSTMRSLRARYGRSVFLRGVIPIAVRNSSFATFLFVGTPAIQKQVSKITDNETITMAAPSIIAGALSALISHPADTIKTARHAHPHYTSIALMRLLWDGTINGSSKIAAYYTGIAPRIVGVALTMALERNFDELSNRFLDATGKQLKS